MGICLYFSKDREAKGDEMTPLTMIDNKLYLQKILLKLYGE